MLEQLCLALASLLDTIIVWIASICCPAIVRIDNIATTITVVFLTTLIVYCIQHVSYGFIVRLDKKYELHERIHIVTIVKPTKYRKGYSCFRTAEDMEDGILNNAALSWATKTAQILLNILVLGVMSELVGEPTLVGITPKIVLGALFFGIDRARENLLIIGEVAQLIDEINAFLRR